MLRKEKLYANLQKCTFFNEQIAFSGFVVSAKGVQLDYEKSECYPRMACPLSEIKSFQGLFSFYRRFLKNLSTLTTL